MSKKGTNNKSVYSIKIELCFARGYPENKYSASSGWCCKRDQAHALESETKDDNLVKLQLICRMERDWNVVTSYAIGQSRFLPQGDILYACAF